MTDRDVIWACPKCAWAPWEFNTQVRSCSYCPGESALTALAPLARATQLQRAMTVIAEGLEDYLDSREYGHRKGRDPVGKLRDVARHARKALTEFERTEGEENDN